MACLGLPPMVPLFPPRTILPLCPRPQMTMPNPPGPDQIMPTLDYYGYEHEDAITGFVAEYDSQIFNRCAFASYHSYGRRERMGAKTVGGGGVKV